MYKVLEVEETEQMKIEILEVPQLKGARDVDNAMKLYFAKEAHVTFKQIRITLKNGSVKTEAGALYMLKGNIECEVKNGGVTGLLKNVMKGTVTSESAVKPVYRGVGEIYLEPTLKHYAIMQLNNEEVIVDKGMFCCSTANIAVEPTSQKNISSAVFGGEGFFQTSLKGTGLVVLELPVPRSEIIEYYLDNEKAQIDGNFAILRSGDIRFSVEKSAKSLTGTMLSGEGLLQTFSGSGVLWVAPTAPFYDSLSPGELLTTRNDRNRNNKQ
ncbi:AIM24 family protein [Bacillus thuringiensis]|uniref:AIM24 family protein n=1 Tax=Bacillus thuringiensis TaxID=1428 RepID=UPI0024BCD560|nr:AIM24 family protein [Bacillus thuringiensis]